jgi:hypothetical protein
MKFNILFLCAFLLGITRLSAQIMYNEETLKKRYDQETILLMPNAYEKNGFLKRFSMTFPSGKLRQEIEKNGGSMARARYKEYIKNIVWFWVLYVVGIVGYIAIFILASLAGTLLVVPTGAIIGLVLSQIAFLAANYFMNNGIRQLSKAVWLHNREVLLRKE